MTQEQHDNSKSAGGARWAWGIGLFYACFAIGMASLAIFCSTQRVDLVRKDYYEAGVNHQQRVDAESRALSLSQPPVVVDDDAGNPVVTIPGMVEEGTIHFYRPDNPAQDFRLPVAGTAPTAIPADKLVAGRWTIDLTWRTDGKTYAMALPYYH